VRNEAIVKRKRKRMNDKRRREDLEEKPGSHLSVICLDEGDTENGW
jgi:hypothetical protein